MLEVVYDAFAVKKIHGGSQPVPVETLGRSKGSGSARDICNGYDLLEGNYLNHGDDDDDVDVAHEKGGKEGA